MIILDDREHHLIAAFEEASFPHEVKRLDLGDVHFIINGTLEYIVERKTLNDLSASIIDGRWREQKVRLNASGAQFAMLVESAEPIRDTPLGAILNAQVRDSITVFRTLDPKDTATVLAHMESKITAGERSLPVAIAKKQTQGTVWERQLMCVQGISLDLARRISAQFGSPRVLLEAYNVAASGSRPKLLTIIDKIGPKLSSRVYESFYG